MMTPCPVQRAQHSIRIEEKDFREECWTRRGYGLQGTQGKASIVMGLTTVGGWYVNFATMAEAEDTEAGRQGEYEVTD